MSKHLFSSAVLLACLLCTLYLPGGARSNVESSNSASSCKTFHDLENALLNNETNRIALSITFFPLEDNPPEFVKVTFDFGAEKEPQIWYWSKQMSHFLHPFKILHFLSLFFNKPAPYYSGTVNVTLDPDCAAAGLLPNIGVPQLQLLTQRLKLYAASGSPNIALSDTYSAKAYDSVNFKKRIDRNSKQVTTVIIYLPHIVVVFSVIMIVLMLLAFIGSTSHTQSEWFKKVPDNKPAVLSIMVLSLLLNCFILSLDIIANYLWYDKRVKHVIDFFHDFDTERNLVSITTVLFVDGLGIFSWFIIGLSSCCIKCRDGCTRTWNCCGYEPFYEHKFKKKHSLPILSLTVLSPILCIIAHSQYIAIAYLNDGSHASSMLIYYAVLISIFYGILLLFFHWCVHYSQGTSSVADVENQSGNLDPEEEKIFTCCTKKNNKQQGAGTGSKCCQGAIIFLLAITLTVLLGLVATATCYFVFIPINRSITDAPSRMLSIYESGGFLIGFFIVYKVLRYFYSKKNEKKKDEEMEDKEMTNKEVDDCTEMKVKNTKGKKKTKEKKSKKRSKLLLPTSLEDFSPV